MGAYCIYYNIVCYILFVLNISFYYVFHEVTIKIDALMRSVA